MSESLGDIARRQQHADRAAASDPLLEAVVAELLALAEEICVLRDRQDSADRLLAEERLPTAAAIDAFEPSPDVQAERLSRHKRFYEALFARLDGGDAI